MKQRLITFGRAMLQPFLVAINVYEIAHEQYVDAFIVGTLISFVWTFNVRSVVFGDMMDRVLYAFGAGVGTIAGLAFVNFVYK